jgi:hypothetical protein
MTDRVVTFAPFAKITEEPDGSLLLEGVISAPVRDRQGEIITADAMRAALPGWPGNIREMHTPWAAGRAIAAAVGKDGATRITAKIVDKEAAEKVRQKVYTGFSIAGAVTHRKASDPTVVEGLTLSECSLVDVPACPAATFTIWKADGEPPPAAAPPPEPLAPTCPTCKGPLTCAKCSPVEAKAAAAASRLADLLAKGADAARVELTGALAKVAAAERERDGALAKLATAEAALAKRTGERDALQVELHRRPKGALRATPISKRADVTGIPDDDGDEPLGSLDEIRRVHRAGGVNVLRRGL